MPGATTARLAEPDAPICWNEFMMPTTVPNRPTNGPELAIVARNESPRSSRWTSSPRIQPSRLTTPSTWSRVTRACPPCSFSSRASSV